MRRTAVAVYVHAVGLIGKDMYVCAKLRKESGCRYACRSVRAVDSYLHSVKSAVRRALDVVYVVSRRLGCVRYLTDVSANRLCVGLFLFEYKILDLFLDHVGELKAVFIEYFNTVEFSGVVRCRDHNSRVRSILAYEKCDSGRRNNAKLDHVCAYGAKTCYKSRSEHIRGRAGIASYNEGGLAALTVRKNGSGSSAYVHSELRRKLCICNSSDTVSAKKSSHKYFLSDLVFICLLL